MHKNQTTLFIDLYIFYKTQKYSDTTIFQVSWDWYKCPLYKLSLYYYENQNLGTMLWYGTTYQGFISRYNKHRYMVKQTTGHKMQIFLFFKENFSDHMYNAGNTHENKELHQKKTSNIVCTPTPSEDTDKFVSSKWD